MGSPQSSFRRSNYRHHENSMLKLETYNMLWDLKETLLQSSKSRFRRSGSDLSVKTCSDCQLKIAVPNRSRRRFRAIDDVLSAKMNELSPMITCNRGPKRQLLYRNWRTYGKSAIIFSALKLSTS